MTLFATCALAAPATYVTGKSATAYTAPVATILNQISQFNDDGSYTFGYENSDGSFRIETMDVNGYITGKYGYVDAYGQPQETGIYIYIYTPNDEKTGKIQISRFPNYIEYVAGKMSGASIGFQARGSSIPKDARASTAFPFVRTTTRTAEQKALDYLYNSVDEDEDGIPDASPVRATYTAPTAVRVVESAPVYNNVNNVRVAAPAKVSYSEAPTVVRVAEPATAAVQTVQAVQPTSPVRIVSPSRLASYNVATPTVVRVADPYSAVSNVRLATSTKNSYRPVVRVVAPQRVSYDQPTVVRVADRGQTTYKSSSSHLDDFLKSLSNRNVVASGYDTVDEASSSAFVSASPVQVFQDDSVSVDSFDSRA